MVDYTNQDTQIHFMSESITDSWESDFEIEQKPHMLKVGITGTRSGANEIQLDLLTQLLTQWKDKAVEFHHGDCVGVDVQGADIATSLHIPTICHPPVDEQLRAWHKSTNILLSKTHFARNRDIVNACDLLIVVPFQQSRQSNGGTWYTYDYAVKHKVDTIVIFPDGQIESTLPKTEM